MTCRCIRAVFVAFLLISLFQATRFQQATTAQVHVDGKMLSAAESADSWKLLERVRVFSTMTTSYNWSARFDDDRDRDKTLTVVFSYSYIAGHYSDTTNVKQAGTWLRDVSHRGFLPTTGKQPTEGLLLRVKYRLLQLSNAILVSVHIQ